MKSCTGVPAEGRGRLALTPLEQPPGTLPAGQEGCPVGGVGPTVVGTMLNKGFCWKWGELGTHKASHSPSHPIPSQMCKLIRGRSCSHYT